MSRVCEPPRAVFAAAVRALAENIVRALSGADDAFRLAGQAPRDDAIAGLAAIRILGPDALAPFTLAGHGFTADDAEVIVTSIAMFPEPGSETDSDDGLGAVRQARDWATSQLLERLGAGEGLVAGPQPGALGAGKSGWVQWSSTMARLSPLAFDGLDSPLHAQVRQRRLDIARGITRSVLRQDLLTAARLTRWLAASSTGSAVDMPLLPGPVLRHLELFADPDPQLDLEIVMARRGTGVAVGD